MSRMTDPTMRKANGIASGPGPIGLGVKKKIIWWKQGGSCVHIPGVKQDALKLWILTAKSRGPCSNASCQSKPREVPMQFASHLLAMQMPSHLDVPKIRINKVSECSGYTGETPAPRTAVIMWKTAQHVSTKQSVYSAPCKSEKQCQSFRIAMKGCGHLSVYALRP